MSPTSNLDTSPSREGDRAQKGSHSPGVNLGLVLTAYWIHRIVFDTDGATAWNFDFIQKVSISRRNLGELRELTQPG